MMSQAEAQWCRTAALGDLTLTAVGKGTPGVDRRDLLLLGHLLVFQDLQTQD